LLVFVFFCAAEHVLKIKRDLKTLKPISLKDANKFVHDNHRHHGVVVGYKFALSIEEDDKLKGVAICSRPVSRKLDDGLTLEVSRLCVVDLPNGCSMLYSACARTAKEMGYNKIITYILESETGTSLKASGWICEAEKVGGTSWNSSGTMQRTNSKTDLFGTTVKYPNELKSRWVKMLNVKRNAELETDVWRGRKK